MSNKEFFHSAQICEFFWFMISLLLLLLCAFRIFKLKEDFSTGEQGNNKYTPTKVNESHAGKDSNSQSNLGVEDVKVNVGGAVVDEKESNSKSSEEIASQGGNKSKPGSNDQIENINLGSDEKRKGAPSTKKKQEIEKKLDARKIFEELVYINFPMLGVVILNVINNASYIFCTFILFLFLLTTILVNSLKIFEKFNKEKLQPWFELIPNFLTISLLINYLANDQKII